ncbi:uncharacterized protein FTJAE_11774 [Fusarium tjaetaba]|uniref:Uncharacterized protein n=1 Tax=Fusarium tjaetaba TaxID=1567544 RepID=A0A8H5VF07_9HYPO|nr:uncharacterized protein FTJAE_11774 [Fusarium tjaetaba]KAF5619923.1 hypothetical protein FTJAE_11774 [Fusarium tjaetaba]
MCDLVTQDVGRTPRFVCPEGLASLSGESRRRGHWALPELVEQSLKYVPQPEEASVEVERCADPIYYSSGRPAAAWDSRPGPGGLALSSLGEDGV